jgi:2-oxoglutarate ferredoxin oxidoreductase subunit beta
MVNPAYKGKTNDLGFAMSDYDGLKSTLCQGCGHDAITRHLIKSFFELNIQPTQVAKMSGIGCSSKTPTYFMNKSHGFNAVHGRMPSVTTGAKLANENLIAVGVSGDGDTASIGLGQFIHLIRRNLNMAYIIENNGVYGLTKGQFSATADEGSKLKSGEVNNLQDIDCCAQAIELGNGYVARSFSGDAKQCVPLLKGAISYKGLGLVDVISPCITFNNHDGSTKSFSYVKEHDWRLQEIDYVESQEEIAHDQEPGTTKNVGLHDGSYLSLTKLSEDHDPTNSIKALEILHKAREKQEIVTGLLYVDPDKADYNTLMKLEKEGGAALYSLDEKKARMGEDEFKKLMETFA